MPHFVEPFMFKKMLLSVHILTDIHCTFFLWKNGLLCTFNVPSGNCLPFMWLLDEFNCGLISLTVSGSNFNKLKT